MDWPFYEQIVTRVFEPLVEEDGIPDEELDTAVARLGVTLPGVLRQLYRLSGRRGDLHRACEDLILPPALQVRDGNLIFYQNTLEQRHWAIPLHQGDDPPVFREGKEGWEPDYPSLSAFLLAMLFWQAVNGGMAYFAHGTLPRTTLERFADHVVRTPLGGNWKLEALWREGIALVYSREQRGEVCQILCGYSDPQSVSDPVLTGVVWEQQGQRKAQVRYRKFDLSSHCAGCGRSKLTWADTSRGICARCGHPL